MHTTDRVLCTTERVNFKTDRVVRTTDSVNISTDRMKVYNRQFVARTATTDRVMRTTDREYLYHSISMNAGSHEETCKKETANDTK